MSLYFVRHQHSADTCPTQDPEIGNRLLTHLSPNNASKFGIEMRGEAVLDGQHTFVLILEAANKDKVQAFLEPFSQAGSVEIFPASACETVVERSGC
jgi:hypothetical protein